MRLTCLCVIICRHGQHILLHLVPADTMLCKKRDEVQVTLVQLSVEMVHFFCVQESQSCFWSFRQGQRTPQCPARTDCITPFPPRLIFSWHIITKLPGILIITILIIGIAIPEKTLFRLKRGRGPCTGGHCDSDGIPTPSTLIVANNGEVSSWQYLW